MRNALQHIDAIAFDLDGTLVDSAPDIQHALNLALHEAGLACFDLTTVRAWIGDGPDATIARALGAHGLAHSEPLRHRLRASFDAATLAAPLRFGRVFKGIAALVAGLRPLLPMAVVTNKPTSLARAVLDAAGLLPAMRGVYGADEAALRKPAPLLLQAAARQLGVPTARLLMVGDGAADLLAALAAGSPAALVGWGYGVQAAAQQAVSRAWPVATPEQLLLTAQAAHAMRREQGVRATPVSS